MTRLKNPWAWLHGLISAGVGGSATAISTIIVAPETFNFKEGLAKLGTVAAVSAIVSVAMYLKQSPLPPIVEEDTVFIKKDDIKS
jgi:hypothetical protein